MSEWQDIETARKDGRHVLLVPWGDIDDAFVSFWVKGSPGFWANNPYSDQSVTHWLPLEPIDA